MLRRFFAAGLCGATAACGLVIGLDERGPRADAGVSLPEAGDGGPTTYCDTAAGAIFCDDFDQPGQLPKTRWEGLAGGTLPSPLVTGDASLAIESLPGVASSGNQVLNAEASRLSNSELLATRALLFNEVQSEVAIGDGIVYSFDAQLRLLRDERLPDAKGEPSDVGPFPEILDEAKVVVASIAADSEAGSRYGAVFTVGMKNLAIAEAIDSDTDLTNYQRVADVDLADFGQQTWVRLHMATGPREKLRDRLLSVYGVALNCPDAEYVLVGWADVLKQEAGCIASVASANPIATGKPFVIALGAWVSGPATASVRFDTVRVDLIR